jgi:predicted nucleic acid-binding protein
MSSTKESKKPRFYLDACIFISLFADEKRANGAEYTGLKDIEYLVDRNKVIAVTSTISRVECLFHDNEKAAAQQEQFFAWLERPNVEELSLVPPIAQTAHDIEINLAKEGKTPGHIDAIHLATAMYAEVDKFYTYDGCKKNTKLLALNGHPVLHGLEILIPKPQLHSLQFED